MIALDTNVIVPFLVTDDAEYAAAKLEIKDAPSDEGASYLRRSNFRARTAPDQATFFDSFFLLKSARFSDLRIRSVLGMSRM